MVINVEQSSHSLCAKSFEEKLERAKFLNPCANTVFQTVCVPDAHKTGEIFPTAMEIPFQTGFCREMWILVE